MQNLYWEPFVFECAEKNRMFYIPKEGKMELQLFHVEDLCRLMELILEKHPEFHIINIGNQEVIDINRYVELCYQAAGSKLKKVFVTDYPQQRDYFCFYDYSYKLNIDRQNQLFPNQKDLYEGLKESYEWYCSFGENIIRKDYIYFIDSYFKRQM